MNENRATGVNDGSRRRGEPWNSVRVLRVISSAPQYYHSVRIDQRQHRAIHVLPEKYQFCSIGSVGRFNSPENITTEQSQTVTGFGRCRAKVHYGLCTDFDVFVVNQSEESPPISNTTNRLQQQQQQQKQKSSQRPTQLDFNPIDWNQRFVYSDKTPSIQQSYSSTTTTTINRSISNGSVQQSSLSSSPIIDQFGSIVARIESYRENIGAALELLTTDLDEEPAHLENLIRNFVREDRLRQSSQPQSPLSPKEDGSDHDFEQRLLDSAKSGNDTSDSTKLSSSLGRKTITVKKSTQADLLERLQQQQKAIKQRQTSDNHASSATFLSSNREGVVQSRLNRFGTCQSQSSQSSTTSSRETSPSPIITTQSTSLSSLPSNDFSRNGDYVDSIRHLNHTTHDMNRTVFGISPKSSSLSRYKTLIESRSETSSPVNFGTGIELVHPNDPNPNHHSSSTVTDVASNRYHQQHQYESVNVGNGGDTTLLEITSQTSSPNANNLDSSHRIHQQTRAGSSNGNSRFGSWRQQQQQQQQQHLQPNPSLRHGISSISNVNDTPKCIASSIENQNTATISPTTTNSSVSAAAASPSFYLSSSPSSNVSSVNTLPTSTSNDNLKQQSTTTTTVSDNCYINTQPIGGSDSSKSTLSSLYQQRPNDGVQHSQTNTIPYQQSAQSSPSNANNIDTFIQENEKFFHRGGNKFGLTRSVGVIENVNLPDDYLDCDQQSDDYSNVDAGEDDVDMKVQPNKLSSLTDDEKALLHETLKVGLYGGGGDSSPRKALITNGTEMTTSSTDSTVTNGEENRDPNGKPSSNGTNKPNRRIILVSKPVPKPEPKPEPKYVNGKVVFGQLPVKPVLQKGSVAERVMLFEKCPEKTSVTKSKLTELQKNRIINPNKIGHWVRSTVDKDVKIPKIANNTNNDVTTNGSNNFLHQNNNHNSQIKVKNQLQLQSSSTIANKIDEPKSPTISNVPTFRRFSRSNSLTGTLPGQLPRFYFPNGRPYSSHEVETQIKKIISIFERFPSRTVTRKELGGVLKLAGLPVYWKEPLFQAVSANAKSMSNGSLPNGGSTPRRTAGSRSNSIDLTNGVNGNGKKESISCDQFTDYWKKLITNCFDEAARFMSIITKGKRNYMVPEDLESMIQDVIDTHPGLLFLKEAEEFHSRYVHTVIARVFYCLDKNWSGMITLPELRKSNFLKVIQLLEDEEDINQITEYFSYEHFYVIYCKFWELDQDHDLYISKYDLSRHDDSAISSRMIDRIFSGAVTRGPRNNDNQMSYAEFVWFLLSEEDKRHPRAIEYWFRCMDLDGDGFLSFYELEYFYSEQVKRMEAAGIEALPFTDCLCQMIDLASPQDPNRITLNDLKRCRLTPVFFDTFFNLEKYLDHEQRDPFASQRDEDGVSISDWDRYAAEEYELLVAEENAQNGSNRNYHDQRSSSSSVHYKRYPIEEFVDVDEFDDDDEVDEMEEDYTNEDYDKESEESATSSSNEDITSSENDRDPMLASSNNSDDYYNDDDSFSDDESLQNVKLDTKRKLENDQPISSTYDDIDDIGKEFYEYLNSEFNVNHQQSSLKNDSRSIAMPKTIERRPLNPPPPPPLSSQISTTFTPNQNNDLNNNPVNINHINSTLDDDDFW